MNLELQDIERVAELPYKWDELNDIMTFDHVGCLECGNCRLVCERLNERRPGYDWNYPIEGRGFLSKEG